jgi:tetratricopeptide (TPR) repeat protein
MIDVNTEILENANLLSHLKQYHGTYSSIVEARVSLARGISPNKPQWRCDPKAELAESLEALRTSVGYAIYTRDAKAAKEAISEHMFRRLPIADQMLWRGLYELTFNDTAEGRTLLEEVADKYEYPRAALILSLHLLDLGKIHEAQFWLDKASPWGNNTKIKLLRAYMEACQGKVDTASDMLEALATNGDARAYYALGNLNMQRADMAMEEGDIHNNLLYRGQAAESFHTALNAQNGMHLYEDLSALILCSEFLANPDNVDGSYQRLWGEVKKLDSRTRRPWLTWSAFIAQLWYGTPSGIISSGEEALKQAGLIDLLTDSELAAISSAVAHACIKADNVVSMNKLILLLEFLSSGSRKKIVEPYYRLGVAALARKVDEVGSDIFGYGAAYHILKDVLDPNISEQKPNQKIILLANSDPGNAILALLLSYINLKDKNLEESATALRNARPDNVFEQRLCTSIADLLEGNTPSELPQPTVGATPEIVQACHLLNAASAFCSGNFENGYKEILDAMKYPSNNMTKVIEISRILPALCVQSAKDPVPPRLLIETIRETASKEADGRSDETIARCAAAMDENDIACDLWNRNKSQNPDGKSDVDYAEFLCYLAVQAHKSGKPNECIEKLRLAASVGGKLHV